MSYETVLVEASGGVGTITLNRPEVRNALNQTMVREIWEALQELEADREVRVAVLRGEPVWQHGFLIHPQDVTQLIEALKRGIPK